MAPYENMTVLLLVMLGAGGGAVVQIISISKLPENVGRTALDHVPMKILNGHLYM